MSWLEQSLATCSLTPEVESYLLGRGAKPVSIQREGIVTWQAQDVPLPDEEFRKRYGSRGEALVGALVCPVRSPRGKLIGFEARSIREKRISDYRLHEAAWNPFFLGTKNAVEKLWMGGDAWIVEGLFDLFPLEWAVPSTDAVLATVRARLSVSHVEFLRRFCRGLVNMVYDRDETGRKGITGWVDETGKKRWGALQSLGRVGLKCRDVPYGGGKDPGEIWDRGGVEALRKTFAEGVCFDG